MALSLVALLGDQELRLGVGLDALGHDAQAEGVADAIIHMLKEALSGTLQAKVGAVLARQGFEEFRKRVDWSEYGGAPLLGVKGVAIVCHGRSPANAIKNALGVAKGLAERRVNEKIERELTLVSAR